MNEPVESDVVNVTVPVGDDPVTDAVHVVGDPAENDGQDTDTVAAAATGIRFKETKASKHTARKILFIPIKSAHC